MDDNFLKHWFKGFEHSLQSLDDADRKSIFAECGKGCSDSYTKQIYREEYQASENMDDFLSRLKRRFPEIGFRVIKENEVIELTYHFCACDLVANGYLSTPLLCECSRQSLLYNWGSVFGQDRIAVQLHQSILEGNSCCKFTIHIRPVK